MEMQRVWNISDHPDSKAEAGVLMVLGRSVAPGHYVQVLAERLVDAHQVKKDVGNKLLYIGAQPPASYLAHKKPVRATLPKGVARSHGAPAPVSEPVKVETPSLKEDPMMADPAPKAEEPKAETIEETTKDSDSSWSGKKKTPKKGK